MDFPLYRLSQAPGVCQSLFGSNSLKSTILGPCGRHIISRVFRGYSSLYPVFVTVLRSSLNRTNTLEPAAKTADGKMQDTKVLADQVSHTSDPESTSGDVVATRKRQEAPPYIRTLSPEGRTQAENALVRKIDLRLIPMIILIYIVSPCPDTVRTLL